MKKKTIGIDIDAVLADSDGIFLNELSRLTGRELKRGENNIFKYEDAFSIPDETMKRFWDEFTEKRGWIDIPAFENASDTVKELYKDHNIVIVSARPPMILSQTKEWLDNNSIPYDELFLTDYRDKAECLSHINDLKYFIEDSPQFATGFLQKGISVILFDHPWNKDLHHQDIIRVKNWKDIYFIFFRSNLNT